MNTGKKSHLYPALRNDLSVFIQKAFSVVSPGVNYEQNWHVDLMADYLEQTYYGESNRLVINVPPRYLKSICASVAYVAWLLGRDPTAQIICASYSAELAAKHARDCRSIIESDWYKHAFPGTRLRRSNETDLETTKGGMRYTTSLGGSLTGRGADYIIIDDPIKPEDCLSETMRKKAKDWYDGTLYSRLNSKADGVIILVMQRLHVDDLVAHVMEKGDWDVLTLPAVADIAQSYEYSDGYVYERAMGDVLHEERESLNVLDQIKETIGNYNYYSQYQQQPIPVEGNLIKWDWFEFYEEAISLDRADYVVQSWDTASKSTELANFSVCITCLVRGEHYFVLDVFREKLEFPALYDAVISQAQKFRAKRILIEDMASGTQLIQSLKNKRPAQLPSPEPVIPKGEKIVRIAGQSTKIRDGRVHLPRNAEWMDAFHKEILAFPYGAHDDQVDALSQFLQWFDSRSTIRVVPLVGL